MNAILDGCLDNSARREFLKASGALVVAASAPLAMNEALAQAGAAGAKPALVPEELDSWVAVLKDGRVAAFYGKIDMGQCLEVAIAQIVADELDVTCDQVTVYTGDTDTTCNQGGASGAFGISAGAKPLRNAAAEARRILVEAAAANLGVPASELRVDEGVVSVSGDAAKRISYAQLIGGRYFNARVEWNKQVGNFMDIKVRAKPKSPSEYRVVGKSFPRRDVPGRVFCTADWVTEVKVPGMLHARVIRPARAACTPVKVDEASIKSIKGARVVREGNFLAVVAPKEWDAVRAARMLKVEWSEPKDPPFPAMERIYDHIRGAKPLKREEPVKAGDLPAAFKNAARVIEAEYEWPFHSHASMGPACAVVDARKDRATLWTGTQKPHYARDGVARILGLPSEAVRGIWVNGPGSYGRNDSGDAALDAALLSKMTGKPVRVQGSRADGIAWDAKGPAAVHRARAALDASGKVIGYEFVSRGFSRLNMSSNESDPADTLVGMEIGLAPKPGIAYGTPEESYGFASKLLAWEVIPPLLERCSPLRTTHLRDPVGPDIHFGSEQFIDELAAAAGEDPVAFRLKYVTAPRDAAVIRAAAEKAGWQPRVSPRSERAGDVLTGRGISYAQRGGTIVAAVAEVEVDRRSGRIWTRKLTIAHDCGLIINPSGLRATIENCATFALSRTLFEEVQFDRNAVTSVGWSSYPILEIQDAPESIDIVTINHPEIAPSGAGEPTARVIPGAVANALFDATGVRLRRAPLTAARVKAALERA